MIRTTLKDAGTGNELKIKDGGQINVTNYQSPPLDESVLALPFGSFFTDDGTPTGSEDMRVDGSTNPQDFFIKASGEFDIFIKSINAQISDPGARLDRFGALPALTNGLEWEYQTDETGLFILNPAIRINLDFFRDATGGKGFGTGTDAWKADIAGGGGEDTYFPEVDFTERFGLRYGLRLRKGSQDRMTIRVNDNLSSGLSTFNIKAYGIRI